VNKKDAVDRFKKEATFWGYAESSPEKLKESIEDCQRFEEEINEWLNSEESQAGLRRAVKESQEIVEKMKKSRRIDWRTLNEPVNI